MPPKPPSEEHPSPDPPGAASSAGGAITSPAVTVVTMPSLPGHRVVRVLGTVYGLTVRARNWGADLGSFFRSAAGGELKWLTNLNYRSRNTAVERMIGECVGLGGNAVLAMRYESFEQGLYVQTCAYGTACLVEAVEGEGVAVRAGVLAE